jgi:hypothetical protein
MTSYSSLIRIEEELPTNGPLCETWARMSHPDPNGPPDRRPIKVGEVWENPVTGERSVILERPWDNPASRVTGELTAVVGARVMGEHRHPGLVEQFTVLEGALSILCWTFEFWWTRGDSNPRPPRCERGALPAELLAHEQQQIHLSKAEMGCQHAPRPTFSAKRDMQISRS